MFFLRFKKIVVTGICAFLGLFEVKGKNFFAHVTMQGIFNKISEAKFSVRCIIDLVLMVSVATWTTSKSIDEISYTNLVW